MKFSILLTLIAFLTVTAGLPVFALWKFTTKASRNDRIRKAGGTPLLGEWVMEYGYWLARVPLAIFRAVHAGPDVVTFIGLAFVLGGSIAVALGMFSLGGALMLIGSILDACDGILARELDVCSDAGEFLDAVVDRYAEFAFLAGLAIYYRTEPWAMVIVFGAMLGSIVVSYARAKAESLGVMDAPGGLMRRHERGVYLGFGTYLAPLLRPYLEHDGTPIYHLTLAACALVAVFANINGIRLIAYVRAKLRRNVEERALPGLETQPAGDVAASERGP